MDKIIDIMDKSIDNKRVTMISFLRNNTLFNSRNEAIDGLKKAADSNTQDGTLILARYIEGGKVKTILGIVYSCDDFKSVTVFGSNETISWTNNDNKHLFYENIYESHNNTIEYAKSM